MMHMNPLAITAITWKGNEQSVFRGFKRMRNSNGHSVAHALERAGKEKLGAKH